MSFYRVRVGQVLGINDGEKSIEKVGGDILELNERQALELSHKVDECDEAGNLLAKPTDTTAVEKQLATARPHERISILEVEREKVAAQLKAIDDRIEAEKKAPKNDIAADTPPAPEIPGAGPSATAAATKAGPKKGAEVKQQ